VQISATDGVVVMDMQYCLQKILIHHDNLQVLVMVSMKETIIIDKKASAVGECQKAASCEVVWLLYLSKRNRPDIMAAVSFLGMRVKALTMKYQRKLLRVLGYLQGTEYWGDEFIS